MPNPTPTEIFGPNFTSDTDAKTFTFTYDNPASDEAFDLHGITNTSVNPYSGDARTLVYALLDRIAEWYEGLANDAKPTNFRISRSGTLTTSDGETFIQRNYNVACRAQAGELSLINEA